MATPDPNPYAAGASAAAGGAAGAPGIGGIPNFANALNMTVQSFGGRKGTPWPSWLLNDPNFEITAFDPTAPSPTTHGLQVVYLGSSKSTPGYTKIDTEAGGKVKVAGHSGKNGIATVEAAKQMPALWSTDEVKQTIAAMQAAGFKVTDYDSMSKTWGKLVDRAASIYTASEGKNKVTPLDVMSMYAKESGGTKAGGSSGFTGSLHTVSRTVNDIDEGAAWDTLGSALSTMLGRDPSDEELRDFTYKMSHLAAKNPSISTTIENYKNGRMTSTSTHSKPGFTSEDMKQEAYNNAQQDPDYGAYQAASTYFNAALSALGPIGG